MLAHLGLEYERREVDVIDRSDRPELLGELNPSLRVPTLILDDGRPLAESNAILNYFAEGTEFLPADRYQRAQVFQWMFFEQYSHEPFLAVARFMLAISPEAHSDRQLAYLQEKGYIALDAMEKHLQGKSFLVGARYSIADIALYAYTHSAPEGGFNLAGYPAINAWLAAVAAQPGHITLAQ
jgi:glutathione S-transferase